MLILMHIFIGFSPQTDVANFGKTIPNIKFHKNSTTRSCSVPHEQNRYDEKA
jgi:23S rRNA C2498 (ribose-2'-O)-methylase RlmM